MIPKLPKLLEYAGRELPKEIAALTREWASGVQDVLRALKSGQELHDSQIAALQADLAAGTGWSPSEGVFQWFPDMEPASPGSDSIYFPSSSWTGWTEWDPGTCQTWDVDTTRRMGRGALTGNGGIRWGGMYKAIPGSEFSFCAQISTLCTSGAGGTANGLLVAGDISGSPTTANFLTNDITYASGAPQVNVRAREWDAYNGATVSSTNAGERPHPTHFRCRVNGTSVSSDYSHNGVTWIHYDTTTVTFTPAYFGVAGLEVNNAVTSTMLVRYIQTFSGAGSSAYNANFPGRAASLPIYP